MGLEVKIKDKEVKKYKIKESNVSNTDPSKLSILCQQEGNESCELVQVPVENIMVKYSSFVNEPKMRLEILDVGFKGWKKIYQLGVDFSPLVVAYIEVPKNYQGILGQYVNSQ